MNEPLQSVYLVNRSPYALADVPAFRPGGLFGFEAKGVGDAPGDGYFGGVQTDWHWGLPGAFQALAEPRSGATLPAWVADHGFGSASYWFTLHYVLMFRLGWSMPGIGLARWLADARKTNDPVLQLVAEVWGQDGFLLDYISWAINAPSALRGDREDAGRLWQLGPQVLAEIEAPQRSEILAAPDREDCQFTGGYDPFHLSHHGRSPLNDSSSEARLLAVDPTNRTAHFVTDRAEGWYRALEIQTGALPIVGDRSWHVDVYVKGLGHLGTFRRSRQTGLWFAGKHSIHMLGN